MAGGTGGHIMPGLAVAELLRAQGVEVHWLGTAAGLEARLVPKAGIPLHIVAMRGLRGKSLLSRLLWPWQLLQALIQAVGFMRRISPQVVIGFGGYVAAPGGIAAWLLRRPLFIHEQNAVAGSTNRALARLARTVYGAYPGSFPQGVAVEVVGNPVRADISALPGPEQRGLASEQPLRVLVLGGSQGARILNQTVPAAVALMAPELRPRLRHQAGRDLATAEQAYAQAGLDVEPEAFIEDMPAAYAQADLVICRAGALSLAEIMAAGLPAICVPLAIAIDDHQKANASHLVQAGAAWMLTEDNCTAEQLAALLEQVLSQPEELRRRASKARELARPQAAHHLAQACLAAGGSHD
nr:undecaprenyldiphospho-muramoylpentapeptide beta-N-acetylglucosaminyltransferase [Oceanococcus sp. HetDA_MAG_MS8]